MAQESPTPSQIASLILRVFTFVFLLISLIVLATTTVTAVDSNDQEAKISFEEYFAYRYMLSTIVIGTAYTLTQLAFSIYDVLSGNDGSLLLTFFGDKFISYMLATGAGAGFGLTVDLMRLTDLLKIDMSNFFGKAYASVSLLLLAFISTAALSIISAFTLPKRVLDEKKSQNQSISAA